MKHFKIFVSLMLACMMMLALVAGTVSAEGETGTITINNAKTGATYSVYKILQLSSYDETLHAYKYKAEENWIAFFKNNADSKKLFSYEDETQIVTLKNGLADPIPAADIQAFAKAALAYAEESNIAPTDSKTAANAADTEEVTVVFENLELGYYLVQSSIGTVLSLDTTHPDAEMNDKNATTTVTKTVDRNNLSIGEKVTYTIQIDLNENIDYADESATGFINDLVLHDIMDSTLTLDRESFGISATRDNVEISDVDDQYEIKYDQHDQEEAEETCTFHIEFANEFFKAGDVITVIYDAVLNETAVIGQPGNKNETYATYGGHTTPKSEVKVYTGMITIDKYAEGHKDEKLSGAEFILRNSNNRYYKATLIDAPEGDVVDTTEDATEGEGSDVIIIPSSTLGKVLKVEWVSNEANATVLTTDDNGTIVFAGIPAGRYSIIEKKAPDGFNRILNPVSVTVPAEDNATTTPPAVAYMATVEVPNKTGVLLPATGGIGTTLFIVFGSIAAIAAGVILVARRRMKLIGSDI